MVHLVLQVQPQVLVEVLAPQVLQVQMVHLALQQLRQVHQEILKHQEIQALMVHLVLTVQVVLPV